MVCCMMLGKRSVVGSGRVPVKTITCLGRIVNALWNSTNIFTNILDHSDSTISAVGANKDWCIGAGYVKCIESLRCS